VLYGIIGDIVAYLLWYALIEFPMEAKGHQEREPSLQVACIYVYVICFENASDLQYSGSLVL